MAVGHRRMDQDAGCFNVGHNQHQVCSLVAGHCLYLQGIGQSPVVIAGICHSADNCQHNVLYSDFPINAVHCADQPCCIAGGELEELLAESAIEILGQTVPVGDSSPNPDGFHRYADWLVRLDIALGVEKISFLGNETVLLGLSAAIGAMERNDALAERVWPALERLLRDIVNNQNTDPIAYATFEKLRQGIDTSKVNVGQATREMVFNTFKEYIRGAGDTPMYECWQIGAARF